MSTKMRDLMMFSTCNLGVGKRLSTATVFRKSVSAEDSCESPASERISNVLLRRLRKPLFGDARVENFGGREDTQLESTAGICEVLEINTEGVFTRK